MKEDFPKSQNMIAHGHVVFAKTLITAKENNIIWLKQAQDHLMRQANNFS